MSATGPYRKLALCMWQDRRFRALSPPPPSGQTLWITLIAGEHTTLIPGLSRVGEHGLAEALGWDIRSLRAMWVEIDALRLAEADWGARVIWVKNAIRYNPPENPNVVKSWARVWSEIPECALKDAAAEVLMAHMRERGARFVEAFAAACPSSVSKRSAKRSSKRSARRSAKPSAHGLANQEQEPEPEPEPEQEHSRPAGPADAAEGAGEADLTWLQEQLGTKLGRRIGGCGNGPEGANRKQRLLAHLAAHGRDAALAAAIEVDGILRSNGEGPLRSLAALPGFLDTVDEPRPTPHGPIPMLDGRAVQLGENEQRGPGPGIPVPERPAIEWEV